MHDGFQRQTVGQFGRFVGIAQHDGRHGNHPLRKFEYLGDHPGRIDRRTEVADAQPVHFGLDAEVLGRQQGVRRSVQEPCEVIVCGIGVALLAPHREAVHVGADRHHARRLRHHRLVEMARGEFRAQGRIARHDQRIELHVAAGRSPRSRCQYLLQQLFGNGCGTEFTYRTMLEKHTFHGFFLLSVLYKNNTSVRRSGRMRLFSTKIVKLLEVLLFLR